MRKVTTRKGYIVYRLASLRDGVEIKTARRKALRIKLEGDAVIFDEIRYRK